MATPCHTGLDAIVVPVKGHGMVLDVALPNKTGLVAELRSTRKTQEEACLAYAHHSVVF